MRAPEFWQRRGALARLLAPLGMVYGASVAWNAKTARPFHAPLQVLCVGNLTAGGSGKTPVAIAIGQSLIARGARPFFLSRGYGGREPGPVLAIEGDSASRVGDEALLLARTAPTIVARDRAKGAMLANFEGASVLVMDDGHQNFSLHKNISIIVVDGETGFGNGLMIPAGPLREKVAQGLGRADAVVIVGEGSPALDGFSGPTLRARLEVDGGRYRGQPVFAFAGIGRPEKFVASLQGAGAIVAGVKFFPDHHPYRAAEIAALRAAAKDTLLVTTEKDFVRLTPAQRQAITALPVRAVFEDETALSALLERLA